MKKVSLFTLLLVFIMSNASISFAAQGKKDIISQKSDRLSTALQKEIKAKDADKKSKYEQEEERLEEAFARFKEKNPLEVEPKFEDLNQAEQEMFFKMHQYRMAKFIKQPKPGKKTLAANLERAKARYAYTIIALKQNAGDKKDSSKKASSYEQEEARLAETFARFKAQNPLPFEPKFEDLSKPEQEMFYKYHKYRTAKFVKLPKLDKEVLQQYLEDGKARYAYIVAVKKQQAAKRKTALEREEDRVASEFAQFRKDNPLAEEPVFDDLSKTEKDLFYKIYDYKMSLFIKSPKPGEEVLAKNLEQAKQRYAYILGVQKQHKAK